MAAVLICFYREAVRRHPALNYVAYDEPVENMTNEYYNPPFPVGITNLILLFEKQNGNKNI